MQSLNKRKAATAFIYKVEEFSVFLGKGKTCFIFKQLTKIKCLFTLYFILKVPDLSQTLLLVQQMSVEHETPSITLII